MSDVVRIWRVFIEDNKKLFLLHFFHCVLHICSMMSATPIPYHTIDIIVLNQGEYRKYPISYLIQRVAQYNNRLWSFFKFANDTHANMNNKNTEKKWGSMCCLQLITAFYLYHLPQQTSGCKRQTPSYFRLYSENGNIYVCYKYSLHPPHFLRQLLKTMFMKIWTKASNIQIVSSFQLSFLKTRMA